MNKQLRVALIGAGSMGRHHGMAVRQLGERANLVAVVDSRSDMAESVAEELGAEHVYNDYVRMLENERPDVVHICTPPVSHATVARAALEAGANVYVEKPFTETGEEAREILDLAERLGLKVCAGHQVLFEAPTRIARELLPRIGTIKHVESFFAFRPARRQDGRPQRTPVEQMLDILPHPTYLLLHFLGADRADRPISIEGMRVDETGSLHSIISAGDAIGTLIVTLEGRPVDSFVRIVGTQGTLTLDYVRGIVIPSFGTGTAIEKIVDPYRRAGALTVGSTKSLAGRLMNRRWSYPGLTELFGEFYGYIAEGTPAPVTPDNILRTVEICDLAQQKLRDQTATESPRGADAPPTVAVTGGNGMLGRAVVTALLDEGETPLVLGRRLPLDRDRREGVHYARVDLADRATIELPSSVHTVIHCAAEVHGSWDAHQRNSIDATRNLLDAMKEAGTNKLVHVSSLAVVDAEAPQPISEESPLERDGRRRGAYVWGKLESEKVAAAAPETHGVDVRIVRPAALVDGAAFDPPGKLGRAIVAGFYVAVGSPKSTIPLSDVQRTGRICAWIAGHFDEAPKLLHAVDPQPASRRELSGRLRDARPGTRVVWLYRPVLAGISLPLILAQRVLRRGSTPIDLRTVFDSPRCDTRLANEVESKLHQSQPVPVQN